MRLKILGVAGLAILPAVVIAQTPTNPPTPTPTPTPTTDSTKRDTTTVPTTQTTEPTTNPTTDTAAVRTTTPVTTPTTPTTNLTVPTTPITTTDSAANLTTGTPTTTTTTDASMSTTSATMNTTGASISSMGAQPATGSAFAMGNRTAARDSLVNPKPVPPSDGTTCPWGCPTSRGTAGLTGPQFLALQQELRDAKCGLAHVTGRLDAATRTAIRTCAKKMGVANNAAAVLVGFDIGFSASDVNTSGSDAAKPEE
jgi:hypothetical protein